MAKRITALFILLAAALFLFGFDGKIILSDYKANNAEEEKIIANLIDYQKAYNEKDKDRLLSFFSADAKLKPCGDVTQLSKDEYAKIFPDKWKYYPEYEFFNPKILLFGTSTAEVKLNLSSGGWIVDYQIDMVNENGKWFIQQTSY